ncbi:MAG: sulfurtransferase TusA family protein [Pseudomonadota bacterium]
MSEHAAAELDTRGLLCPLPVIRTQDQVKTMPSGTMLRVVATDPGTLQDIPAWCRVHGHEVKRAEEHADEYIFTILVR